MAKVPFSFSFFFFLFFLFILYMFKFEHILNNIKKNLLFKFEHKFRIASRHLTPTGLKFWV